MKRIFKGRKKNFPSSRRHSDSDFLIKNCENPKKKAEKENENLQIPPDESTFLAFQTVGPEQGGLHMSVREKSSS